MGRARSAGDLQRRLQLLLGVVALAFSLLAMHQLSSNHTAADPRAAAGSAVHQAAAVGHGDDQQLIVAGGPEHAHGGARRSGGQSDDGDCPGCADHHAMALTCLATLILLAVGGILGRPAIWRAIRLRRPRLLPLDPPPRWRPVSLTLLELSVSRT